MNIIKNGFKNERLNIELDVYGIDGKEWFKAQDVSEYLGYAETKDMTRNIDFIEENTYRHNMTTAQGNNYEAMFINEIALYEIICKIRKSNTERYAKAREFQKWVFSEVLPSLRKHGAYVDDKFENTKMQERYLKMKSITLLMCEKKQYCIGTASEIIFNGNRATLKRYLIENGYINEEETEVYKSSAKDSDGKIYPLFLKKTTENIKKGVKVVNNRILLTGYGVAHFMNKLIKL